MSGHPTCPLCGTANIAAPDEAAVGFARCYLHGVYRDRPDTDMAAPEVEEAWRGEWRIGGHYRIHVYERDESAMDDRPVATFHREDDARRCVNAVNVGPRALDAAEQRGVERVAQRMRELAEECAQFPTLTFSGWAIAERIRTELADVAPPTAGQEGL